MGHENEVPDLAHLFERDYAWWAKSYPPGFDLLPERWRHGIEERVRSYLEEMEKPYILHHVNHFEED